MLVEFGTAKEPALVVLGAGYDEGVWAGEVFEPELADAQQDFWREDEGDASHLVLGGGG